MNFILTIIIGFILITYLYNLLVNKRKRETFIQAGKKWDGIVNELSRRK